MEPLPPTRFSPEPPDGFPTRLGHSVLPEEGDEIAEIIISQDHICQGS